jgi:hypothetical protein
MAVAMLLHELCMLSLDIISLQLFYNQMRISSLAEPIICPLAEPDCLIFCNLGSFQAQRLPTNGHDGIVILQKRRRIKVRGDMFIENKWRDEISIVNMNRGRYEGTWGQKIFYFPDQGGQWVKAQIALERILLCQLRRILL